MSLLCPQASVDIPPACGSAQLPQRASVSHGVADAVFQLLSSAMLQVGPVAAPDRSGTRPTQLLQLLLAPDVHRHASPQLLNRVAGLLLQVHGFLLLPLISAHFSG